MADMLRERRDFDGARRELAKVFGIPELPAAARAVALLAQGRLFLLEDRVDETRGVLRQAREAAEAEPSAPVPVLHAGGPTSRGTMPDAGSDRAEIDLLLGILDAREGDGAGLRRVLEIPDVREPQAHTARIHLRLRNLDPGAAPASTVLFIGSSHSQVRNVPQMVEQLALSAPAGRTGVLAGMCLLGGAFLRISSGRSATAPARRAG